MVNLSVRTLAAVMTLCCATVALQAVEYRFPADAGIIDVKRDCGAKGDGRSDDTKAIQSAIATALKGNYRNPRMVYMPVGTYLISAALKARITDGPEDGSQWCNGWRSGLFLVGESRERTVLKLADTCAGFTDPKSGQAMLISGSTGHGGKHGDRKGGWGNEGFQNTLMNFTVDTGRGNPGAIGVDFLASNRGSLEGVTIRSGDPEKVGVCGIDLSRSWPGPALVTDCAVEGFDVGMRQKGMDCSMTYEHMSFTDQKVCAVQGIGSPFMSMCAFTIRGAVPPFAIDGNGALIAILDSSVTYTGSGEAPAAIACDGYLVVKHLTVNGFPTAIESKGGKGPSKPAVEVPKGKGEVPFYSSRGVTRLHPGSEDIPDLPIKDTPQFHNSDLKTWANPRDFAIGSRTAGIQEAIDSGAETIYFPNGSFRIAEPIVLRGKVRKLFGCEAQIQVNKGVDPAIRFAGVDGGMVHIEHLHIGGTVEHDCDQTLVMRKCDANYRNTVRGTGDVFLSDGMFGHTDIRFPQHFWGRQVNSEYGSDPEFSNRGGTAWVLGLKVEGDPQALLTIGGVTECYGLYAMTGKDTPMPFVENNEGWLAVMLREGGQKSHKIRVKDTWDGDSQQKGGGREIGLAVLGEKVDPQATVPAAPGQLSATAETSNAVTLTWTAAVDERYGIASYVISRDGTPLVGVDGDVTTWTDSSVGESRSYSYEVYAVNRRGGHSPSVAKTIATPADTQAPSIREASVWSADTATLVVDFSEPMDVTMAAVATNYQIDLPIAVKSVRLNAVGDRAIVTLASALADGQTTTVTCRNLCDRSKAKLGLTEASATVTVWKRGDGLKAEYWNAKASFDGKPVLTRVEDHLDNWWGENSPDDVVQVDDFSCRYTAVLRVTESGAYTFQTGAISGARLTIDDQMVIDAWNVKGEWHDSKPITLEAGKHYRLVLESHHDSGGAGLRLKWSGPGINGKSFIGPDHLFSDPAGP